MPFWRTGSMVLACVCAHSQAQTQPQPQLREASATRRTNSDAADANRNDELTLAGLRPGRDAMAKALRVLPKSPAIGDGGASRTWRDDCRHETLAIIADGNGTILQIRVAESTSDSKPGCRNGNSNHWATGHGLVVGDSCSRVISIYGQPGTRGPSTQGGQQLELFYYAFDWAGPDVPQVMTVLCTPESQDKPGRVVEITLAAPSL